MRALRNANGLGEDDALRPGDRLTVPPPRGGSRSDGSEESDETGEEADEANGAALDRARMPDEGEHVEIAFHRMHSSEDVTVDLWNDDGELDPAARQQVNRIFRHVSTDRTISVSADLMVLVQLVADHFPGHTINVHSAVRPVVRRRGKPLGNHMLGRALDLSVEGVSNEDLRDFCRSLDHSGVGYYPNSTFVHLDAREDSWYWVDVSGPGESARYVDPDLYEETDQERSREGEWTPEANPDAAGAPAPAERTPATADETPGPSEVPAAGASDDTAPDAPASALPSAPGPAAPSSDAGPSPDPPPANPAPAAPRDG